MAEMKLVPNTVDGGSVVAITRRQINGDHWENKFNRKFQVAQSLIAANNKLLKSVSNVDEKIAKDFSSNLLSGLNTFKMAQPKTDGIAGKDVLAKTLNVLRNDHLPRLRAGGKENVQILKEINKQLSTLKGVLKNSY